MKIYDSHVHILFEGSKSVFENFISYFREIDVVGFNALVIAEYPIELKIIQHMVPEEYQKNVSLEILSLQKNILPILQQVKDMEIVPYLDARYMETEIEAKIKNYHAQGFRGLKLLYVPERDDSSRIDGMEIAFKRYRRESEKITSMLIDAASLHSMTVLIHVDIRKYADFVAEMLESHPHTNFNIAHFGLSRRSIIPLLERYSNCYTDMASLVPFIKRDPSPYIEFIKHYEDRVLFASDALIGDPEAVLKTSRYISGLLSDTGLTEKIFYENYLTFHNSKH